MAIKCEDLLDYKETVENYLKKYHSAVYVSWRAYWYEKMQNDVKTGDV